MVERIRTKCSNGSRDHVPYLLVYEEERAAEEDGGEHIVRREHRDRLVLPPQLPDKDIRGASQIVRTIRIKM